MIQNKALEYINKLSQFYDDIIYCDTYGWNTYSRNTYSRNTYSRNTYHKSLMFLPDDIRYIVFSNKTRIGRRKAKISRLLYNVYTGDILVICSDMIDRNPDYKTRIIGIRARIKKIQLTNGICFDGSDCFNQLDEYIRCN